MDTEYTGGVDANENNPTNKDIDHTGETNGDINVACIVCGAPLSVRLTQGRKSGKTHIMLTCPISSKHFRGFVCDQNYISEVFESLEDAS